MAEAAEQADIFEVPGGEMEVKPEAGIAEAKKPRGPKKELSAERKAQLLEQLKKGRETARKNREAKKRAKKATASAEQPPAKKADAPAPAKPAASQEPSPAKGGNDHSDLISELKGLREEIALSRAEKRERAAAKRKAQQQHSKRGEGSEKAETAGTKSPTPAAPAAAAPALVPKYRWNGRTGRRELV